MENKIDARLTSVAYIGPKSRTERPRKTNIGTEIARVARDSDATFKVKRSKVNLQEVGAYCGGLPHSLLCPRPNRRGHKAMMLSDVRPSVCLSV